MNKLPTPSTAVLRFLRDQTRCYASLHSSSLTSASVLSRSCLPRRKRSFDHSTSNKIHTSISTKRDAATCCLKGTVYFGSLSALRQNTLQQTAARSSHTPPQTQFHTSARTQGIWSHWRRHQHQHDGRGGSQQRGLPPLASFLDDATTPGRALKATSNEPKLRCTEFDGKGDVTLVNGEFKKSELIARYGLLPRDLRKIDSSLLPSVISRPSAILINLLHLRVLIRHDRVLVLDAYGSTDSYTQSVFMYDLEGKLRQAATKPGDLPYEFRALEAVLVSVTTGLESEFEGVREPVVRVLRELEEDIDRDKLRYLLVYSKKLGTFEQKARLVRDALDELLEADDDLAAMYLTEKAAGKERGEDDHEEVELLLESYHKVTDEIVQAAGNLVSNIRNTEEIVKAILDSNRNSLMLLDLRFSIWTLGLTAGTFFAALYGMNLKNFIEESDLGFGGISLICGVASIVAISIGARKLRKVQRVSMWGQHHHPAYPYGPRSQQGAGNGGFWDKNPKKNTPAPIGWSGLDWGGGGGASRALRMEESGRRHEYWLRHRQEEKQRQKEEKLRKHNQTHGQSSQPSGGSEGSTPEGGYC